MPYAFAHPVAVIPLHKALGRASVPSALAIGSVIPDAWYFIPLVTRPDSHGALGLFLFCLPAGLLAYLAYHIVFKAPLLALLPAALAGRLRAFTAAGVPRAAWAAVLLSLALGSLTHLLWDAFTHHGRLSRVWPVLEMEIMRIGGHEVVLFQLLQHASTLLGAAVLVWWVARKLRSVKPVHARAVPGRERIALLALLVAVPVVAFAATVSAGAPTDGWSIEEARRLARAGAVTALWVLGLLATAYCVAWKAAIGPRRSG